MLKAFIKKITGGGRASTAHFMLPPVVFEIAPGFVSGAAIEGSRRGGRQLRKIGLRSLDAASLEPHLSHANILNTEEFGRAAAELISRVGNGDGRYGLILPDGAMRVALLSFESLPEDAEAAEALIRWRMRDKLPFNAEEARVSYQILSRPPGPIEVLALAMRVSVIEEYEASFASLNGKSALILPATVALLPLLPEMSSGLQVLIHVCGDWLTVVVLSGSTPLAWRTRELDPLDATHFDREVASESARLVASVRDRTQEDVGRAWLCARPPGEKNLVSTIADTMGHDVGIIRVPSELVSQFGADERARFDQFGAPIAGIVANAK